jgi:hypothetical protein
MRKNAPEPGSKLNLCTKICWDKTINGNSINFFLRLFQTMTTAKQWKRKYLLKTYIKKKWNHYLSFINFDIIISKIAK